MSCLVAKTLYGVKILENLQRIPLIYSRELFPDGKELWYDTAFGK